MHGMTVPPLPPPGWHPDPATPGWERYWAGSVWTEHVRPIAPPPAASNSQAHALAVLAVWALLIIGCVMALFTSVSLMSGTTTVWIGVALAAVGVVAAFVTKRSMATKVIALILVGCCFAGAIYDEVQLQHKRDQLNNLFGN